jgi:gamma-glutamyltranspeptidase/glutathione hydrolase
MDDFSVATGVPNAFNLVGADANAIAPGKRSLSSMTPTFVESDKGLLIIGTPGGSTIISMVTQGVLGWLDGESAATVVAKRRLHHQYLPDQLMYEPGALTDTEIAGLRALGHNLKEWSLRGNLQVITWDYATGAIEAAADPRGAGVGLVY